MSRNGRAGRGTALAIALAADALVGDSNHHLHPVAVVGRGLDRCYAPWRGRSIPVQLLGGAAGTAAVAGVAGGCGWALENGLRRAPLGVVGVGAALKPTFALRQLLVDCRGVADSLEAGDLAKARTAAAMLVSRPTAELSPELVASATIESAAENLADSVVAPFVYFLTAGLSGASVYRVVNTADAMVGYRDEREWLGKAAARADDALNLLPSRISCLALAAAATLLHGPPAGAAALRVAARDQRALASPNAGWPVAAMAGALGRRLEKPDHYAVGSAFRPPDGVDVRRAVEIVELAAVLVAGAAIAAGGRRPAGEASAC